VQAISIYEIEEVRYDRRDKHTSFVEVSQVVRAGEGCSIEDGIIDDDVSRGCRVTV